MSNSGGQGSCRAVWVYRDMRPLVIDTRAALADRRARAQQSEAVAEFVQTLRNPDGSWRHGLNEFDSPEGLAENVSSQLDAWLTAISHEGAADEPQAPSARPAAVAELLTPAQRAALASLRDGGQVDDPALGAARKAPVTGLTGYWLQRHGQWAGAAGGRLDRRFVNLRLLVDRGLQVDGERFVPDMAAGDKGRFDDLAKLLRQHDSVAAWVLVGEPGSGKSTVLQHHELAMADAALGVGAGVRPAPADAELCLWQRLSEYDAATSAEPGLWLVERWAAQYPQLPPLAEMMRSHRVRLLLDGLNEIKAPDRVTQLQAIERWADWAAQPEGRRLAPIFSVRTLEQSPLSRPGSEVRQITLAAWTDKQVRDYTALRLGEGNALWPAIEGDRELLSLCRLPMHLDAQCGLFRHLGRPARDRAELLSGQFWLLLRRPENLRALQRAGLLADQDWQRLAGDGWTDPLLALPEQGCLVRWLDATAQAMHRDGREVSVARQVVLARLAEWQATDAATGLAVATPEHWLQAVTALGLVGEGGMDAFDGQPLLRFVHQLWQEFFAGRGLRDAADWAPARWPGIAPEPLPDIDQVLARLGRQEPLPGPAASHWEEPAKLAVQLSRHTLPLLRALQARHVALAGRAAARVLPRLQAEPGGPHWLATLRQQLVDRSRSPQQDLRLRIEAAEALGPLGDPRYAEGLGPDGQRCWLIADDAHWVTVAGGEYTIGRDGSPEPDEHPAVTVELPSFSMAWAPVTNAEFRCFVEAEPKGYEDLRWWVGEAAQRWWRGEWRNDAEIERWRAICADLRRDFDGTVARFLNVTEAATDQFRELAQQSEADTEAMLKRRYGARQHREPLEWQNPRFNQPLQPVVGVCLFEAQAYTAWLAAMTGRTGLALPTEAQWEAAARHPAGGDWPWGRPAPSRWQLNADPAHLRRTSPVGVFASADHPAGLTDLAGNVWEWTASAYTDQPDAEQCRTGSNDPEARRVVRGGSWYGRTHVARAGYRNLCTPGDRDSYLGFRLVCCPIPGP